MRDLWLDKDGLSWCSKCGPSQLRRPSELHVIKHRHSTHVHGHILTYCSDHLIEAKEWYEGDQRSWRVGAVCPHASSRCLLRGSVISVAENVESHVPNRNTNTHAARTRTHEPRLS